MDEDDLIQLADGDYTHFIFDDSFLEEDIRHFREKAPGCVFVAIKDMRYAMDQSEIHDAMLFLPLLITELAKSLTLTPGQNARGSSEGRAIDNFHLADAHVLVVDDNEINLMVSEEMLRSYKAEVTCAESGREALDLCAEKQFDLIFMDHMMPGMDGMETTVALRERNSPNKSTPVIALTANVVNDMRSHYLQCGMNDFIGKPIEIADLRRVLLRWLPDGKIVSLEPTFRSEASSPRLSQDDSMKKIIRLLDDFGMYVSDVMREIGNDYNVYIRRMDRIRTELRPLVARLREEVRAEDWHSFARDISAVGSMIHDVGARDCSGRARKLAIAARNRNADYIRGDFLSLMDNMYMLGKKMEVAVPLAQGGADSDTPFGDIHYCRDRIEELGFALSEGDYESAVALLDDLAHYSLDHALDMILVQVIKKVSDHDFAGASAFHAQAVQHCDQLLSVAK
jgi:CheY-like chemotaxis protein